MRRALLTLALLLLLGLGLQWARPGTTLPEAELPASPSAVAEAEFEASRMLGPAVPSSTAGDHLTRDSDPVSENLLTGVVFMEGKPTSGARVSLVGHGGAYSSTLYTDEHGVFRAAISEGALKIEATWAEDWRGATYVGAQTQTVEIHLKRGFQVLVQVTDPLHQPIADARVQAGARVLSDTGDFADNEAGPVETDAKGQASLIFLKSGVYEVEAEHDDRGVVVEVLELRPRPEPQRVKLVIPEGGAVVGRALDPRGVARPDVAVMLVRTDRRLRYGARRAVSDSLGNFRIAGVEPGQYQISPEEESCGVDPTPIEMAPDRRELNVDVTFPDEGSITGRVLDPSDAPIAARLVIVSDEMLSDAGGVSDSSGRFSVTVCAGRTYKLRASALSSDPAEVNPEVEAVAGDRDLVLRARAGAVLIGTVKVDDSEAIPPFVVRAGEHELSRPAGATDFKLANVSVTTRSISVDAPGYAVATQRLALEGGRTYHLVFQLQPGLSLEGRVLDAKSGQAIEGAMVWLDEEAGAEDGEHSTRSALSDANGHFTLRGLTAGACHLHGRARGYLQFRGETFNLGPDTPNQTILLRRGVSLRGRVLRGADPAPGHRIYVFKPEGPGRGPRGEAETDQEGAFLIEGLESGPLSLLVTRGPAESPGEVKVMPIVVPEEGLQDLEVQLLSQRSGRLIVSLPKSSEFGAVLMLTAGRGPHAKETPPSNAMPVAPSQTEAIFEGLEPGPYVLTAMGLRDGMNPEGTPFVADVTISEGQDARVSVPPF